MTTRYEKITLLAATLLASLSGRAALAQDLVAGSSCLYGRVHGLVAGEAIRPMDRKRDFQAIQGAVLTFRNCTTGEELQFESVVVQAADATDASSPTPPSRPRP